jgi:hypothetical protein
MEFLKYFFRVLHEASGSWLEFLHAFQKYPVYSTFHSFQSYNKRTHFYVIINSSLQLHTYSFILLSVVSLLQKKIFYQPPNNILPQLLDISSKLIIFPGHTLISKSKQIVGCQIRTGGSFASKKKQTLKYTNVMHSLLTRKY